MDDIKNSTESATEQIDLQREAIIKLAKSRAAQAEIDKIVAKEIQDRINLENELREEGIELNEEVFEKAKFYLEEREKVEKIQSVRTRQRRLQNLAGEQEAGVIRAANLLEEEEKNKERLNTLFEFIEALGKGRAKDTDDDKKYTKEKVQNFNKQISAIKKVGKVQNDFAEKRAKLNAEVVESENLSFDERRTILESEEIQGQASIDLQEQQALKELEQIEISEELKGQARANIELYYDDLRKKNREETSEAMIKIDEEETEARLEHLKLIGSGLMAASEIAGKTTGAGKALAVAGTLLSTYAAAQKAYESQMTLTPDAPFRAYLQQQLLQHKV